MAMMDSLDEKLIRILSKDARQSNEKLGEKLGVSATTVRRRLRRLIDSGVLRITARVDPVRAGLPLTTIIAFDVANNKVPVAIKALAGYEQVKWVSTTTGRYDILAMAAFHSAQELSGFLQHEVAKIEGLRDTETYICLEISKEPYIPL